MATGLLLALNYQVDVLDESGAHLRRKEASSGRLKFEVPRIGHFWISGTQNWSFLNFHFQEVRTLKGEPVAEA